MKHTYQYLRKNSRGQYVHALETKTGKRKRRIDAGARRALADEDRTMRLARFCNGREGHPKDGEKGRVFAA